MLTSYCSKEIRGLDISGQVALSTQRLVFELNNVVCSDDALDCSSEGVLGRVC